MVFKNIDGQLITIFDRVQNINNGFDITSNKITDIVKQFNSFNSAQDFGDDYIAFINSIADKDINIAN